MKPSGREVEHSVRALSARAETSAVRLKVECEPLVVVGLLPRKRKLTGCPGGYASTRCTRCGSSPSGALGASIVFNRVCPARRRRGRFPVTVQYVQRLYNVQLYYVLRKLTLTT